MDDCKFDANTVQIAQYYDSMIPQFMRNPLIEALPPILTKKEIINQLTVTLNWNDSVRHEDIETRIYSIDAIYDAFQPLPITLDIEERIGRIIRNGYIKRNPFMKKIKSDSVETSGMSIVGVSGMGKTKTLQRILEMYPQVIIHSSYNKIDLSMYQVVWLKLNCPYDASIKGLLYEFFMEIDKLLNTNYFERLSRTRSTNDIMIQTMYKVIQNCALGVIIVDEIQHLTKARGSGKEAVLSFLVTLSNTIGVPIIYVGTPLAFEVLRTDFRIGRRCSGIVGDIVWERHKNDDIWQILVRALWEYQITKHHFEMTKSLVDTLYFQSQGIPDILKKVFVASQVLAVKSGLETVNESIVKKAAKENFLLIEPIITALKTDNRKAIFEYKDIFIPSPLKKSGAKNNLIEPKELPPNKDKNTKQEEERTIKNVHTTKVDFDIRDSIQGGINKKLSAYQSLLSSGHIVSYDKDIFERRL